MLTPPRRRRHRRPVLHEADVATLSAPYLAKRGSTAAPRFYFQPRTVHRAAGWKTVRLHDEHGIPIREPLAAARACQPLAALYAGWLDGQANCDPQRIDPLGRIRATDAASAKKLATTFATRHRPGTIAAIVADYRASKYFLTVKESDGRRVARPASTLRSYGQCLDILVAAWGQHHWAEISPSMAEVWIEDIQDETPAFGHAIYRVARAALNTTRKLYPSNWHPGHIARGANPFAALDIPTPKTQPNPWPRSLVAALAEAAEGKGFASMADGLLFNGWLGQRTTDLVQIPLARIDHATRPLWVSQGKTGADVILPWQMVPELLERFRRMKARRAAAGRKIEATSFLIDDATGKAFTVDRYRAMFSEVRAAFVERLAARHVAAEARWPAEYLCKHYADDPFAFDVRRAQARTLRHTAVTLLADAQVLDIGAITGHSDNTIATIVRHYRARTVERATAAFGQRLKFEGRE